MDFAVSVAVRGTITFATEDYKNFIKVSRLINFELSDFQKQVKDAVTRHVKQTVTNAPTNLQIPVVQLERSLATINPIIEDELKKRFIDNFGISLKALDIETLNIDKTSEDYGELRKVTAEQTAKTVTAQTDVNIQNLQDAQALNTQNMQKTARIEREKMQRAQKLQTESSFLGAHALNQQTEVLKTGAESLGQMGNMNLGNAGGDGMNPAGMMMGDAAGQQMGGMMNNLGQTMHQGQNAPPPQVLYSVAVNGQTTGQLTIAQLQEMVTAGQFLKESFVWKNSMENCAAAGTVSELRGLFSTMTAPPPPPPLMN